MFGDKEEMPEAAKKKWPDCDHDYGLCENPDGAPNEVDPVTMAIVVAGHFRQMKDSMYAEFVMAEMLTVSKMLLTFGRPGYRSEFTDLHEEIGALLRAEGFADTADSLEQCSVIQVFCPHGRIQVDFTVCTGQHGDGRDLAQEESRTIERLIVQLRMQHGIYMPDDDEDFGEWSSPSTEGLSAAFKRYAEQDLELDKFREELDAAFETWGGKKGGES